MNEITITLEEYKELIETKIRMDMLKKWYQNDSYPIQEYVRGIIGCTTKE